jgi:methyl-accepting chemotaxis protein
MLASLKVRTRLALGFGLVILLLAGTAGGGYWGVSLVSGRTLEALAHDARAAVEGDALRASVLELRRYEKDYFINLGSADTRAAYLSKWKAQHEAAHARVRVLEALVTSDQDRAALTGMKSRLARYDAGFDKVVGLVEAGTIRTTQDANQAIGAFKEDVRSLEQAADQLSTRGEERMEALAPLVVSVRRTALVAIVLFASAALLAGLVVTVILTRSLVVQLGGEPG